MKTKKTFFVFIWLLFSFIVLLPSFLRAQQSATDGPTPWVYNEYTSVGFVSYVSQHYWTPAYEGLSCGLFQMEGAMALSSGMYSAFVIFKKKLDKEYTMPDSVFFHIQNFPYGENQYFEGISIGLYWNTGNLYSGGFRAPSDAKWKRYVLDIPETSKISTRKINAIGLDFCYTDNWGSEARPFSGKALIDQIGFVYKRNGQPDSVVIVEDFAGTPIVKVEGDNKAPTQFSLSQNYPNPFNPETTIRYTISEVEVPVKLIVYDGLGREISVLVNEHKSPGTYTVKFDGSKLSSGRYTCVLKVGYQVLTKKMILLK